LPGGVVPTRLKEEFAAPFTSGTGSFWVSLGQVRMFIRTPAIVRFSKLPDVKLKFTELYIAACSVNGSIRTKTLKFSGKSQAAADPAPLHLEFGAPPL
jgi:hypothetical protein